VDVSELDLPAEAVSKLKEKGYGTLYPPQADAIPKALEGRNLVIAVPTASGKSLIGYVAALKKVLEERKKVLYIVPLKALASEKKDELEELSDLGFKVALSIGDLDSEDRWLADADIIVATSEKADSLLRHGSEWMNGIGLVIADEIHLIHDPGRGPTLEMALTKMIHRNPNIQIIALSATISNAMDIAVWLNAELIRSTWRPTELKEGVYYNGEVRFGDNTFLEIPAVKDEIWELISGAVTSGGQCLVFVNSRKSTESLALKYSKDMGKLTETSIPDDDLALLEGDTESTSLGRKLALCVRSGIAFHHAGLTYKQRRFVEEEFRNGKIKCIIATPTLAAGVNVPARRVIVRDTKRFESNVGNTPISVMEVKQMCGRAGRPRYDTYGEAILIAKNQYDQDHLMYDYVMCDSEDVISKLGDPVVLRSHILGLIASGDATSEEEIVSFLRNTFYGNQSQLYGIEGLVENVVEFLIEEEMVERTNALKPLPFGLRVSNLYIDPESAVMLRKAIGRMKDDTPELMIYHAVTSTPDVLGMFLRKEDKENIETIVEDHYDDFLIKPDECDEYEFFLSDLKAALLVKYWTDELEEDLIIEKIGGVGPGDIRSRVDTVEWILYAMTEIALIFRPDVVSRLRPLLRRVEYGIKEELTDLVSLKGVGRARARILYDRGIENRNGVVAIDVQRLADIPGIGRALAKSLKEQTGEYTAEKSGVRNVQKDAPHPRERTAEKEKDPQEKKRQSNLFDFRSS